MTSTYYALVALATYQLSQTMSVFSGMKERLDLSGDFTRAAHPPGAKAVYEILDKTFGAVEAGLKLLEAKDSWARLLQDSGEFYKKMYDAAKASEELGNSMFDESGGGELQQRTESPYPEGVDYPKSDERPDTDSERNDEYTARGLPSPSEDSEFDS